MKRFKEILCVVDIERDNHAILERAVTLAGNNQANLTVINIIEDIPEDMEISGEPSLFIDLKMQLVDYHARQLEAMVNDFRDKMDIQLKVLSGVPFMEIIQEVLRNKYDLLIKNNEKQNWLHKFFGSNDMHLLRMCPCPIWLIGQEELKPFRRIMAAIDVDDAHPQEQLKVRHALNRQILEMANSLALSEFAELHIVHVWDTIGEEIMRRSMISKPKEEIQAYVEQIRHQRENDIDTLLKEVTGDAKNKALDYLKPQIHLIKGGARKEIPEVVNQLNVDLLVMGTVVRTGIPGFIIGNTAETILNAINCSVLTVKPPGFITPVTLVE